MQTIIFDGELVARQRQQQLAAKIATAKQQLTPAQKKIWPPKIASLVFSEDAGGWLYTRKKTAAAAEVGIEYQPFFFKITDPISQIQQQIIDLNDEPTVTGIIIQKPQRKVFEAAWEPLLAAAKIAQVPYQFNEWWELLTGALKVSKDVDGLSPQTLKAVERGDWREKKMVLSATAEAVLIVLQQAGVLPFINRRQQPPKIVIIGKSDLLGRPLYAELKNQGLPVELWGRKELAMKRATDEGLKEAQVVISATGQANLVTADLVSEGVIGIDVGEPQGDLAMAELLGKAKFLTPVPGGVGPLTIQSLLENCWELWQKLP